MCERALTIREAAVVLGAPVSWVQAQLRAGRVPYQRYGRAVRLTSTQVGLLRDLGTVAATAQAATIQLLALHATPRSQAMHRSRRANRKGMP